MLPPQITKILQALKVTQNRSQSMITGHSTKQLFSQTRETPTLFWSTLISLLTRLIFFCGVETSVMQVRSESKLFFCVKMVHVTRLENKALEFVTWLQIFGYTQILGILGKTIFKVWKFLILTYFFWFWLFSNTKIISKINSIKSWN